MVHFYYISVPYRVYEDKKINIPIILHFIMIHDTNLMRRCIILI
jgi:hypothetical protein